MNITITKESEFEFELVDDCPELRLVVSNDADEYIILTIDEDGVVTFDADAVKEAGLTAD